MLDRTVAPKAAPIKDISIPLAKEFSLSNGIRAYSLDIANQEAVKVDIIFHSGVNFETNNGESYMASKMLLEGTDKLTSAQIAEKLDYYGAFVEVNSGFDYFTFTIYTLNKFIDEVLPLTVELINNSIWPEEEFELAKKIKKQELQINNEKSNIVASRRFRHNLLGDNHSYGTILTEDNLDNLTKDSSFNFYKNILQNRPQVIIAGKIDETIIQSVESSFSQLQPVDKIGSLGETSIIKKHELIEKEGMQSSIRIGQMSLNRNHPDVHLLSITNSVFGGYFGSRLMKNIREDKGFTYGIYSSIAHLKDAAFQVISTDVKKEYTQQTIDEIYKEIALLKSELMSSDELNSATNYLLGQFLSSLDSPFNIATKFKSVLLADVDYQYYYDYINTLKSITPSQVLETATKYLDEKNLIQVIVGSLN